MDYQKIFPHLDLETIGLADLLFQRGCLSEILCEYDKALEDFEKIQFLDNLPREMRPEVFLHQALCYEQIKDYHAMKGCCDTGLMMTTFEDGGQIENDTQTALIRALLKLEDYYEAFGEMNLAIHCGNSVDQVLFEECKGKVDRKAFMEEYESRFPNAFDSPV